jgi:excinuclease ABC subunit B
LIQVAGRAARHISGEVILYADTMTDSIKRTIEETDRRRKIQMQYNQTHGITPRGIQRALDESLSSWREAREFLKDVAHKDETDFAKDELIYELEDQMKAAADRLEFEQAALIRDKIYQIKKIKKHDKQDSKRNKNDSGKRSTAK